MRRCSNAQLSSAAGENSSRSHCAHDGHRFEWHDFLRRRIARHSRGLRRQQSVCWKLFGSKAIGLGQALREGVPVPAGIALSGAVVEAVAAGEGRAIRAVDRQARPLGGPLAVRSSAADEDGAQASFAGQHLTLLNVPSADELVAALKEIWWSANSDSAITYRQRVGLFTRPSIGVVVQRLLNPDAAGVYVHVESGHRRRRAGDRGELGLGRGGRRRARDTGSLPARPLGPKSSSRRRV